MLKVKKYPRRSPYYLIRGTVAGIRIFESTGTVDRGEAEAYRIKREREIFKSAGLDERPPATAADAMSAYIASGGERRFVLPLLDYFKEKPLSEIGQAEIDQAARLLYPNRKPSTLVRQLYGPMIAILHHAVETEMPGAVARRIKMPKVKSPAPQWASEDHLDRLLAVCGPHLKAWILVSTYTGLRASEMLRQRPADYRKRLGWVLIGKTKNGEPAFVPLVDEAREAVEAIMPDDIQPVFGYRTVQGVNKALRSAARRAGVHYLSTHAIGRHTFAARLFGAGKDIKTVKEAGRWKKLAVVDERYGHLEQRAAHEAILSVGKRAKSVREA